ncbi:MAG TPA: type II secretion system protein [Spirochaetes bacterium]|nr:type II secretion system protein [Spirochaetota bacterium]
MKRPGVISRLIGEDGFTLLELILVISILSVLSLLVFPRISLFFKGERGNFIVLTSIISKTFDEAYLKGDINYLVIHLAQPDHEMLDYGENIFSRSNGISVVKMNEESAFVDSSHPLLGYHGFPGSFKIEEVLFRGNESVSRGSVLVPFYPSGISDNVILHILANGTDRWSVKISRMQKEPSILPDYITFQDEQ